jgi:hypothetical protein
MSKLPGKNSGVIAKQAVSSFYITKGADPDEKEMEYYPSGSWHLSDGGRQPGLYPEGPERISPNDYREWLEETNINSPHSPFRDIRVYSIKKYAQGTLILGSRKGPVVSSSFLM